MGAQQRQILSVLLLFIMVVNSRVIISEIMYAPRAYEDLFEFIEIHNTGPAAVTLTGWSLPIVKFTFPTSSIAPGEFKVIVGNVNEFQRVYAHLRTTNQIIGGYTKASDAGDECASCLPDKGGEIRLLDAQRNVVSTVSYDNKKGWSRLANGFGSSLELICFSDDIDINNAGFWAASVLPQNRDIHAEFGGTPGRGPFIRSCFGPKAIKFPASLEFTEIMYHPVGQKARVELHEFIEVTNRLSTSLDVSYWRVVSDSGVRFTFPYGTVIPSGRHVVIAKDVAEFRAVYTNITGTIFGGYRGELANGECQLAIVDNNNFVRDYMEYDDKDPWPRAADAFGASAAYLPSTSPYRNQQAHRYKGQSLTRRTFTWDSDKPEAWYARSPNPGQAGLDTRTPLLPIFGKVKTSPKKNLIRADQEVTVEFELLPWPIQGLTLTQIHVMNFRDDVTSNTPSIGTVRNVTAVYDEKDKVFRAKLPPRGANTIARFKIFAIFGTNTITSPHSKDPYLYHSLFYPPAPHPTTTSLHLFLRPAQWANLRVWAEAGRWDGCNERATWGNKIPCTVVYSEDGVVLPCTTRYQGSQYNRRNAVDINNFPGAPPGGLKAYSYSIKLPKFGKIQDARDIILHKMWQGCPMYEAPIFNRLMEEAGVMGSPTSFTRLHINGVFLRYMLVMFPGSSFWVNRWNDQLNRRCIHQAAEGIDGIGELYKVGGSHQDTGPSGPGDWRVLPIAQNNCPHTELARYKETYSLSTNKEFGTHTTLSNHIHYLQEQVLPGRIDLAARRKWLSDNFDINLMLNYMVVINWAGTWDHIFHNQLLYRRETDRKWTFHPWDADRLYSETSADADLYAGDTSQTHYLRRAIIRNFKNELDERFRLFQSTLHSKARMTQLVQWANGRFDKNQARNEGFGRVTQDLDGCINRMNTFMNRRWDVVNGRIGGAFAGNAEAELRRITCPAKPSVRIFNLNFTSIPGAPLELRAARRTSNSVELRWYPPNSFGRRIVSYSIRRAVAGEQVAAHPTTPTVNPRNDRGGQQTFTDENLTPGTQYTYSIGATVTGARRIIYATITVQTAPNNNNNNDNNNNNNNDNNNNDNNNNDAAVSDNTNNFESPTTELSSGAFVGIVVGSVAFVIVVIGALIAIVSKLRSREEEKA